MFFDPIAKLSKIWEWQIQRRTRNRLGNDATRTES